MSQEPPAGSAPAEPAEPADSAGLGDQAPPDGLGGPAVQGGARRTVTAVLGIAGAVVLVLALVALIGRATESGGGSADLVLPPAAAGLVRVDETVDLAQVRDEMRGRGAAAAYGRAGGPRADVMVVVAADRRSGAAADKLDRFYGELRSSAALVDSAQIRREDPGPRGGALQCHPVTYPQQNLVLDMCVWADEHTVGSVIALPGADNVDSIDELARITRGMRVDFAAGR